MATAWNDIVTELPEGWRYIDAGETEWFTKHGWHGVIGVQTNPDDREQVDYAVVEGFRCPWSGVSV